MTTRIHYEVRSTVSYRPQNEPFPTVLCGSTEDAAFLPIAMGPKNYEWSSRRIAEDLAAKHGGTVHRVTVTTEAVGLEWVGHAPDTWELIDGKSREERKAILRHDPEAGQWFGIGWSVHGDGVHPYFNSLAEAKAAAEAAVKASWT